MIVIHVDEKLKHICRFGSVSAPSLKGKYKYLQNRLRHIRCTIKFICPLAQ